MARYGIVSDIHGNREALLAALAFFDRRGADRIVCLGDMVGLNADPNDCVALLRERDAVAVVGRHDLIGIDQLGFGRCSSTATHALKRTRRELTPETAAYLGSLPTARILDGRVLLVHAGVRGVEQQLVTPRQVRLNAGYLRSDYPALHICMFGDAHEQKVYELEGDAVRELRLGGAVSLREDRVYFVNPGAVDASRKREHQLAECALFDSSMLRVEFHRLAYDHALTEAKAAASGYRSERWTDRYYSLRRRLQGGAAGRALKGRHSAS